MIEGNSILLNLEVIKRHVMPTNWSLAREMTWVDRKQLMRLTAKKSVSGIKQKWT